MTIRRVDRIALDGTTVHALFGRYNIPLLSISYGDGIDPEPVKRMGEQSIAALTTGTYSTEDGSIKLESAVFRDDLQTLIGKGFGRTPFNLVVQHGHPDLGYDSDLLLGVRFTGVKGGGDNSAKALEVEIKIKYVQILWTDRRLSINLDPDLLPGTNKLG